jgi:hypothetical protein
MARYNLSITFPECVPLSMLMLMGTARSLFKSTPTHQRQTLQPLVAQAPLLRTEPNSRRSTSMTASSTYSIYIGFIITPTHFIMVNNMTKITQEFQIPVERLE